MENDCFIKDGAVYVKVRLEIKRDGDYFDIFAVDKDTNVVHDFGRFKVNTKESIDINNIYLECKYGKF